MNSPRSPEAVATGVLPVDQYVAGLARKRMAAGVLFRDRSGRVLLLQPSYKPNWEIPGGAVEEDESPWETARRECDEEMRWDRPIGRLVGMVLQTSEILSAEFHSIEEARGKVKPLLADRITAALEAVETSVTVLCEQGRRVA